MDKRKPLHLSAKLVFLGAALGMALAFVELAANLLGGSLIDHAYSPGRILELAAALFTYVVAVLVWELLDEKKRR